MPCPHPYGLQVEGRCYFCLKVAATNGHKGKLSAEALRFVGFVPEQQADPTPKPRQRTWLQPVNPSNIDKQLEELARLRDIAPGWFELARRILENEGDKS